MFSPTFPFFLNPIISRFDDLYPQRLHEPCNLIGFIFIFALIFALNMSKML